MAINDITNDSTHSVLNECARLRGKKSFLDFSFDDDIGSLSNPSKPLFVCEDISLLLSKARECLDEEFYKDALSFYSHILDIDNVNIEATFYVPYCKLMSKKKVNFEVECLSFDKSIKVVIDKLKRSSLDVDEKARLLTMFMKSMKCFYDEMIEKVESQAYDEDEFFLDSDTYLCMNLFHIYRPVVTFCVISTVNGINIDLTDCRFELLYLLNKCLGFYGWDKYHNVWKDIPPVDGFDISDMYETNSYISLTLNRVRDALLIRMHDMGDDVEKELNTDKPLDYHFTTLNISLKAFKDFKNKKL